MYVYLDISEIWKKLKKHSKVEKKKKKKKKKTLHY